MPGPSESLETFANIHNIYLAPDGATLYAINQSHRTSDLRLLDVSDPAAPREAGRFIVPGVQSVFDGVHDLHVIDHEGRRIAFVNALQSGLLILDVTDPASIVTLSTVDWDGVFSHSGWAFEAGGRLYYANNDEGYDQGVSIFDVSDLDQPVLVSEYHSRAGISVHNVEVVDGIAYLSYYLDGLRVLDLRDPADPREIGHFDTVAADQERDINQGAWGVHVDGGRVYISDREHGIYAFEVEIPAR
ncbi:MAG: choice-of-anchor B family protein [Chloroflexi bacterium]|nr:choice-of-anchor B family protein [Chloroflexota bacterium]